MFTDQALNRNCSACHGDLVDDFNDGHTVPTYDAALVTPWPSKKPDGGEPANANGVPTGNCNYCHDAGSSPDGLAVLNNEQNHHLTGFGPADSGTTGVCFWCHDMNAMTNQVNPTNEYSIRACESCHGMASLHNILSDSDGDNVIYPGAEASDYGHIGNLSDCLGCHGYASPQPLAGLSMAPESSAVVPYIRDMAPSSIQAGLNSPLTIVGESFVNMVENPATGQYDIALESDVALTDGSGNRILLSATVVTNDWIDVVIPSSLTPGTYRLTAVKSDKESNPVVLVVIPRTVIDHVTCGSDGYFLIGGSGFSDFPVVTGAGIGMEVTGTTAAGLETASILLWVDSWILGKMSSCPDEASVIVKTLFTSAQVDSREGGGGKGLKASRI